MAQTLSRLGLGSAFLVAAVLAFGSDADAVPKAAQVIDRTFGCLPVPLAGQIRTSAPGERKPIARLHLDRHGRLGPAADLVSVRTRRWRRFPRPLSREGVYASIARCAPSRVRVPLSANGLPGGAVRWAKHATCLGRGRVIVRVQATLESGSLWQPQITTSSDGAQGTVLRAKLAVRSERTGKPLAYVELARDGTTKAWISPACVQ